ncbi:MAG: hypothetical protein WAM94_11760 [Chromatiaceae bacterium]
MEEGFELPGAGAERVGEFGALIPQGDAVCYGVRRSSERYWIASARYGCSIFSLPGWLIVAVEQFAEIVVALPSRKTDVSNYTPWREIR